MAFSPSKLLVGLFVLAGLVCPTAEAEDFDPAAVEFFEREVRPLLVERCHKCHGDVEEPKGGLKLTSRAAVLAGGDSGAAAIAGKPKESLIIEAVEYRDSLQMPPDAKLNDKQIETFNKWVALGLPWPAASAPVAEKKSHEAYQFTDEQRQFWSFQPLHVVPPPAVKNAAWVRSSIDRFILAGLEARGLPPAAAAGKRALLRRATFDLTGLPPSGREIAEFLADDSPDAFARVVDRLLASPAYGERWGRHWLDVVRYADCKDLRDIGQPYDIVESYRYRDWVVSAFNRDLPYDQFVVQQIAGDLLPPPEPGGVDADAITATGMLTIGPWGPGDADTQKMYTDMVDDQINVVSRAMLGLTIGCARCHDHKFDPIPTADYYSLAGIFFSTQIAVPQISAPYNKVPLVPKAMVEHFNQHMARIAQLEGQIKQFADEQFALLAKGYASQTKEYLLAAWDYRHRTQDKAAQTPREFSDERHLRPDALVQWIDYLGLGGGDGRLMLNPVRDSGAPGVHGWKGETAEPILLVNTNNHAVNVPGSMPPRSVAVHPGPAGGVAVAWRSPITGTVRIRGKVVDAHAACGNGVDWAIERRTSSATETLASGAIANGNGQALADGERADRLESLAVERGQFVQLIVLPKGEYSCDLTTIELEIAEQGGQGRLWNLGADIVPDVLSGGRGNPHADGLGNAEVWQFLDLDPSHSPKRAESGPEGALAAWLETTTKVDRGSATRTDLELVAADVQSALDEASKQPAAKPEQGKETAPLTPAQRLYNELVSDKGPFRAKTRDEQLLPADARQKLGAMSSELATLKQTAPPPSPFAMAASDGGVPGTKYAGFHDAAIHIRGRYDRLGEVVPRRFPRILAGENQPPITQGSGRLQLAQWIASAVNPLTARVMVNRIWQHHFGEAIVRTPGNFGKLGLRPTHPELLDFLAQKFIDSGWSVKAMHRLIMLSASYQQSSRPEAKTAEADPDNLLFGHMNMRRLEAEAIRDSLLSAAGTLDRTLGGRPSRDLASPRRTIYLMTVRSDKAGFPFLFDTADPENIVDERTVSTVAPQALFLLNNEFALKQVSRIVERIFATAADDDGARIAAAYELLYGRPPTHNESQLGGRFLAAARAKAQGAASRAAWEEYCQALVCANEFIYVE